MSTASIHHITSAALGGCEPDFLGDRAVAPGLLRRMGFWLRRRHIPNLRPALGSWRRSLRGLSAGIPPGALPVFLFPYLVGGVEHYPDYFALSMAVFDVIAMLLVLFQVRGECTARTTGNRKGWRLSSVHELASLAHPSVPPPGPTLQLGQLFLKVESAGYWSATTNAEDPTVAWLAHFLTGSVANSNKVNVAHVWCVRGGQNQGDAC